MLLVWRRFLERARFAEAGHLLHIAVVFRRCQYYIQYSSALDVIVVIHVSRICA